MKWGLELRRRAWAFLCDDQGTAGLEFVTSVPLLLGVLVFTAEYGQALRARMALDAAVQDVARYMARAPMDDATGEDGVPKIGFYAGVLTEAQALLGNRIDPIDSFSATAFTVDTQNFRDPYYVIAVTATTSVDLPLLSLINIFSDPPADPNDFKVRDGETFTDSPNPLTLSMTAQQVVRWAGGATPGDADCLLADRYHGLCP